MENKSTTDGWSEIDHSVLIARPADQLYEIWRDLESLPYILTHVKMIRADGPRKSHWVVEGPAGSDISWESLIVDDEPGKRISWRSADGSEVDHMGSVDFREMPGGSTELRVRMSYRPPAGALGKAVAVLLGKDPDKQIVEDMRHFKERVEAGTFARQGA